MSRLGQVAQGSWHGQCDHEYSPPKWSFPARETVLFFAPVQGGCLPGRNRPRRESARHACFASRRLAPGPGFLPAAGPPSDAPKCPAAAWGARGPESAPESAPESLPPADRPAGRFARDPDHAGAVRPALTQQGTIHAAEDRVCAASAPEVRRSPPQWTSPRRGALVWGDSGEEWMEP